MTKFSNKFKNSCFWPIFPIFWAKRFFFKNPDLPHTTRQEPLTPCWVSEKTNEPIQRKLLDRRAEGWKDRKTKGRTDGRTLIHKTLPATAGGSILKIHNKRELKILLLIIQHTLILKILWRFIETVQVNHILFWLLILHYQLIVHYVLEKVFWIHYKNVINWWT